MLKTIHSFWAYVVLITLIFAVFKALKSIILKREYNPKMFQLALLALIVNHIQFLISLFLYFSSERFSIWFELGLSEILEVTSYRLYLIEHPLTNVIAITLVTVGYSKHKKQRLSYKKYKSVIVFYLLALLLILSRIPWQVWPS